MEVVLYGHPGSGIVLLDNRTGGGTRVIAEVLILPGAGSEFSAISFLASPGSSGRADTDGDGEMELYAPSLPMRMLEHADQPGHTDGRAAWPGRVGGSRFGPSPRRPFR
jgi:hypothetical protein